MSDYSVTLSTTEPNNYVGLIKLRQGDVASQSIQATITANGQLFNFDHLAVFFNAVLPNGYVVRDKVTNVDYANSKLNYVVADSFLQEVAQVTAWFSFENDEKIIDSTKNFQYSVIGGWKECIPQGNYIYELSEIQREIEEIIGNKDFTSLISKISSLESNLKTRIDDLENETTAQLAQKVGNGKLASMADMGQDVKTAMTGGSVAVVGENTVIEENVVDKQITPRKTSFLEQDSDNVLDPDFKKLYNCTYSNGIVESNVMSALQPFYINISPINPATGNSKMTLLAGIWYISMRVKTQNGVGEIEPSLFDRNGVRYRGSWYSGNKGAIPTNYVDLKFKITLTSAIESVGMAIFSLASDKYFIENIMISNKDIPFVTYHKYSFGSSINEPSLKIMDEKLSRISKKIVNPAFDFSHLRTYAHRALVHPINTLDGYPENTLPAFEHASNMGVDLVEIDVKRTSDGFFILSHDETIDRVSNGTGKISEMTLSDLRQYDFSYVGGQKMPKFVNELVKIPTLEEAIITAKRLGLNIVLDIGILNWDIMLVHNVVLAHNYEKHVMYNIQSIYYIQRLLSFDPYAVLFYTNSNMPDATTIKQLIELQSDLNTIGFGTQYTHFISSNPQKDENKAIVQQLVNSGIVVSAATINHSEITQHPNLLDDLVSIGIQCICTDDLRIEQKQKIVMNINDYIQLAPIVR